MTKKIAVIDVTVGLGRCSLTAAISVLSAMGIQACPLPTAILSSQTEYPSYYCYDFTDKMDYFRQEWKKLGTSFSGIYTGYVASVCQIEQIMHFLDFPNSRHLSSGRSCNGRRWRYLCHNVYFRASDCYERTCRTCRCYHS